MPLNHNDPLATLRPRRFNQRSRILPRLRWKIAR
jgi:hypothetical protein